MGNQGIDLDTAWTRLHEAAQRAGTTVLVVAPERLVSDAMLDKDE